MKRRLLCGAVLLTAVSFACGTANAQLSSYSQDFEGLNIADGAALGTDGWLVNGLVFNGGGGFKFFYGNFAAPNGGPGFSAIATGEAGAAQGTQYINTYSDYNCCGPTDGHGTGTDTIENRIFREQILSTSDVGYSASFTFDGKLPSVDANTALAAPSTGGAFLRTLDPNAGFSTSSQVTFDALTLSQTDWSTHTLLLPITPALDGHYLQFGFVNVSSNYNNTGVYYDNINFARVPEPSSIALVCLGGLAFVLGRYRNSLA